MRSPIITICIACTARSMAQRPRNVPAHPYLLLPRLVVTPGASIAASVPNTNCRLTGNSPPTRVVGGTPGVRRHHTLEAKARQIQFVDEDVDHTHRVVLDDKVVKTLGQQRNLGSALPLEESLHAAAPKKPDASV
jgi:hypothetical protein